MRREGGLYAVPFDLSALQVTGGPVALIDGVVPNLFALSPSGSALYTIDRADAAPSALVWVSRDGRAEPVDSAWREQFDYPALSPDGRSLAVTVRDKSSDLWIWRTNGTKQRVPSTATTNWRPSWSGDGHSLAFIAMRMTNGTGALEAVPVLVRADGIGAVTPLAAASTNHYEVELSRDGQRLVIRADVAGGGTSRVSRLFARRLSGDTTLRPVPTGSVTALQPALSPDGR